MLPESHVPFFQILQLVRNHFDQFQLIVLLKSKRLIQLSNCCYNYRLGCWSFQSHKEPAAHSLIPLLKNVCNSLYVLVVDDFILTINVANDSLFYVGIFDIRIIQSFRDRLFDHLRVVKIISTARLLELGKRRKFYYYYCETY